MFANAHLRAAIAVSLGAIAGALCRYYVSLGSSQVWGISFPWRTLGVNLSGCFLMGFITVLAAHRWALNPEIRLMLMTGFLGSYTTFSTYALDTALLIDRPGIGLDLIYWLGSPVLGLVGLMLGTHLGHAVSPDQASDRP